MTQKSSIRLAFEEERTLDHSLIGASYTAVGSVFANPVRVFFVQNLTDVVLRFSLDGITNHFSLPTNGFFLIDVTTNKTKDDGLYIAEGDRLYVKEDGTPSSGDVRLSIAYGESR